MRFSFPLPQSYNQETRKKMLCKENVAIMHILLRTFFHTLLTLVLLLLLFNKYGRWNYTQKQNSYYSLFIY